MIEFKATDDQIIEICVNAVNAAIPIGIPIGMGMLQFEPKKYTKNDLQHEIRIFGDGRVVGLDYYEGRMTKLYLTEKKDTLGIWYHSGFANIEYQSWVKLYKNFEGLLKSVGITEFEETVS